MKLETSKVTKLVLSKLERLDPITVFLEDFGRRPCPIDDDPNYWTGLGQLTVRCYGESWTAYWGGMGQRTVQEFITGCDAGYLLNCLSRGLSPTKFCTQGLQTHARGVICKRRRQFDLSKQEARNWWDGLDVLNGVDHPEGIYQHSELLEAIYGQWWEDDVREHAVGPNDDYYYLERIVLATQQGIALYREQTKNETSMAQQKDAPA